MISDKKIALRWLCRCFPMGRALPKALSLAWCTARNYHQALRSKFKIFQLWPRLPLTFQKRSQWDNCCNCSCCLETVNGVPCALFDDIIYLRCSLPLQGSAPWLAVSKEQIPYRVKAALSSCWFKNRLKVETSFSTLETAPQGPFSGYSGGFDWITLFILWSSDRRRGVSDIYMILLLTCICILTF